jgi:hypothetical protein
MSENLYEQLGDHRGHAFHMAGTGSGAKAIAETAADRDPRGESRGVHGGQVGHVNEIGPRFGQQRQVFGLAPGIALEIGLVVELDRIDEDRRHHSRALAPGLLDQGAVAGMQRAHRRY